MFDDLLIGTPAALGPRLRNAESIRSLVNELSAPRLMYLMR